MTFVHTKIEISIPEVNTKQHDVYSVYAKTAAFTILTYEGEEISIRNLRPNSCQKCGEYLEWEHGPNETIQTVTVCGFPEGTTYTSTINVPSGRIVFADSLFHVFPELHGHDDLDYNSAVGRKEYARRLAEHNIAYGCVLNTSPTVYLNTATGGLVIADVFDDYYDENEDPTPEGWEKLGLIITDLWAYSITDYDTFIEHGGDPNDSRVTIAEIPAGKYTFTHYADQAGFDDCTSEEEPVVIFADAVKVSKLS